MGTTIVLLGIYYSTYIGYGNPPTLGGVLDGFSNPLLFSLTT